MTHFLSAEFMYRPRPVDPRTRAVFDDAFTSRVNRLSARDTLLILADSPETLDSLTPLLPPVPRIMTRIVNPPVDPDPPDTPFALGWDAPEHWQKLTMTDRWTRITAALETAATSDAALLMPAHDAVWGDSLLPYLSRLSADYARGGLPAAVSPVTYWQHSAVPGAAVDPAVIALTNTAFGRDLLFPFKAWRGQTQGFWGKMSLMPASMAAHLLPILKGETGTLEDDLVIDSAIQRAGFAARAVPILNPRVYRQALPVFDQDGLRVVIRRTLHYSLNAASPRHPVGGSVLTHPLDFAGKVRLILSPRFRRFTPAAETMIREEAETIRRRIEQYGASWVDWGAYRIVVRVGDWLCEVWKRVTILI